MHCKRIASFNTWSAISSMVAHGPLVCMKRSAACKTSVRFMRKISLVLSEVSFAKACAPTTSSKASVMDLSSSVASTLDVDSRKTRVACSVICNVARGSSIVSNAGGGVGGGGDADVADDVVGSGCSGSGSGGG